MEVLDILRKIMNDKGLSEYQLAKLSDVPQSTINSMFRKNNNPTLDTLQRLCEGLDIKMSDFFHILESESEVDEYSEYYDESEKYLDDLIETMTPRQRNATAKMISTLRER